MAAMPRERLVACLFVAPATAVLGVFVAWPALYMAWASLHEGAWSQTTGQTFAGLASYRALLTDRAFGQAAANTAWFTVLVVPLQTALALAFAVWTNRPGKAVRFLRMAVFVPTTLSLAVLSVVWSLLYAPATATGAGLFNGLLSGVGLPVQPFLASPRQALLAIVAMSVWQGVGLQMMVFLSGLQQIPEQLYEAARLDGAGRWQQLRHITLPALAPTTLFVVMITTIFALKLFVQPLLMTGGGPEGATRSVVQYVYEAAFHSRDLSLACAAGVVFLVAVLVIAAGQRYAGRRAEDWQ
ncbi:MAG: sugar ABC transporter permease [Phycisphaerae bacterium]|jgi:ABC-type sugar transport system permease subunit